ncbi:hypothetical protein CERSUDRAFT_123800, partial [Gelatoporia subvermispora B]
MPGPLDPNHLHELQTIQAFCGCLRVHNQPNAEFVWYLYWTVALWNFVASQSPRSIFPAPQFVLSANQVDNDGNVKPKSKVPDFCLIYLGKAIPAAALVANAIANIMSFSALLDFFRGPLVVQDVAVLNIVEIKGLPNTDGILDDGENSEAFTDQVLEVYRAKFVEASASAGNQVQIFFGNEKNEKKDSIVVTTCVGDRFRWTDCKREMVMPLSENEDGTYRAPRKSSRFLGDLYIRPQTAGGAVQDAGRALRPKDELSKKKLFSEDTKKALEEYTAEDVRTETERNAMKQPHPTASACNSQSAASSSSNQASKAKGKSKPSGKKTRNRGRKQTAMYYLEWSESFSWTDQSHECVNEKTQMFEAMMG